MNVAAVLLLSCIVWATPAASAQQPNSAQPWADPFKKPAAEPKPADAPKETPAETAVQPTRTKAAEAKQAAQKDTAQTPAPEPPAGPVEFKKAPLFKQYKAQKPLAGAAVAPKIKPKTSPRVRNAILDGVRSGPNYNGHYTVVVWGFGSMGASFALVDAATGQVYEAPFTGITWGDDQGDFTEDGLDYKVDSSLLVAKGCIDGTKCDKYFYSWTDKNEWELLGIMPLRRH